MPEKPSKREFRSSRTSFGSSSTLASLDALQSSTANSSQVFDASEAPYPRSSTPCPDESNVTVDPEWSFNGAAYRIFREALQRPPEARKMRVRGLKQPPSHFISGHLAGEPKAARRFVLESMSVDLAEKKAQFRFGWRLLRRIVRKFFRKCYKRLMRRCDYEDCPVTCDCQKVKSFLNKRIEHN